MRAKNGDGKNLILLIMKIQTLKISTPIVLFQLAALIEWLKIRIEESGEFQSPVGNIRIESLQDFRREIEPIHYFQKRKIE